MKRFAFRIGRLGLVSKFNVLTISLILTTAIGIGAVVIRNEMEYTRQRQVQNASSIATVVAQNSEYAIYTENQEALAQIIDSISGIEDIVFIALANSERSILARRALHAPLTMPSLQDFSTLQDGPVVREFVNPSDGKRYLSLITPINSQPLDSGSSELFSEKPARTSTIIGYVQLGLTSAQLDQQVQKFLYSTLLYTFVIALFGVGVTFMLTRKIASPIRELAQVTRQVSEGHVHHQIPVVSVDEVGDLARAFNAMILRLRDYREQVESYQRELEDKVEQRTRLAIQAAEASRAKSQFLTVKMPRCCSLIENKPTR